MVLIDTSIWVHYLRGIASPSLVRTVNALLDDHDVAVTPVIRLELLRGASQREADALQDVFGGLHEVPFGHGHWQRADRLVMELRMKGLTPAITDLLIVTSALEYRVPLYHQNQMFDDISRHTGLEIYVPRWR
jgi:predicted nucleic acid-binding protein